MNEAGTLDCERSRFWPHEFEPLRFWVADMCETFSQGLAIDPQIFEQRAVGQEEVKRGHVYSLLGKVQNLEV